MRLVILESPFAATEKHTVADHERYARACMRDCLERGEAPFASHLLYTQPGVLDDTKPDERALGMKAGFAWRMLCDRTIVLRNGGIVEQGESRALFENPKTDYTRKLVEAIPHFETGPALVAAL